METFITLEFVLCYCKFAENVFVDNFITERP